MLDKLSLYVISRKTDDLSLRKWHSENDKKKTHFGPDLGPLVPSSSYDVFSKNLLH